MKISILPLLLPMVLLSACQTPPTAKDDSAVSTTRYDNTKGDISNQAKPVWVLPVINQGWIPARVDPKTGDWISGHYQATIVQNGYWATQEEAERSGKPYIMAGEMTPIIPSPVTTPATGIGQNSAELTNRATETRTATPEPQLQAMAVDLSVKGGSHTNQVAPGLTPTFHAAEPPPRPANPPAPAAGENRVLLLPSSQPGTSYTVPSGTSLGNIEVKQIDETLVEVTFGGQTQQVRLHSSKDRVKITLPAP